MASRAYVEPLEIIANSAEGQLANVRDRQAYREAMNLLNSHYGNAAARISAKVRQHSFYRGVMNLLGIHNEDIAAHIFGIVKRNHHVHSIEGFDAMHAAVMQAVIDSGYTV